MNNSYMQNPNILNDVAAQQQLLQQQMAQQQMFRAPEMSTGNDGYMQQSQQSTMNQSIPAQLQTYQQTPQTNTPMAPIAEEIDLSELGRAAIPPPPPPVQTPMGPVPAQLGTSPTRPNLPQSSVESSSISSGIPNFIIELVILVLVFIVVLHSKTSYPLNNYLPSLCIDNDVTLIGLATRGLIVAIVFMLIRYLVNYFTK